MLGMRYMKRCFLGVAFFSVVFCGFYPCNKTPGDSKGILGGEIPGNSSGDHIGGKTTVEKPVIKAVVVSTGALNPIHNGHLYELELACNKLTENGFEIFKAILSPSSNAYLKHKGNPYFKHDIRLQMCNAAIECAKKNEGGFYGLFKSTDYEEKTNKGKLYGHPDFDEVYAHFEKEYKNCVVFYVCGSDHYLKCRDTLSKMNFVCIERSEEEVEKFKAVKDKYQFCVKAEKNIFGDLSSTEVREQLVLKDGKYSFKEGGKENLKTYVAPKVLEIMEQNLSSMVIPVKK